MLGIKINYAWQVKTSSNGVVGIVHSTNKLINLTLEKLNAIVLLSCTAKG